MRLEIPIENLYSNLGPQVKQHKRLSELEPLVAIIPAVSSKNLQQPSSYQLVFKEKKGASLRDTCLNCIIPPMGRGNE
ncbi:hypothetical protein CEXT_136201 [Caerostris extrusa]|uniref:Uncharacterized protein n=1 Tax=Caerostris extrusa TaxID=172846 RepID=A0AAV4VI13_CAEEX|nr:hypothetical protein CEXT_136201 [Caerostris extrusa]